MHIGKIVQEKKALWAILGVTTGISILLILSTISNMVNTKEHVINTLINRGRSIIFCLEMTAMMSYWNNDSNFGAATQEIVRRQKDIAYLTIKNPQGKILARNSLESLEIDDIEETREESGCFYSIFKLWNGEEIFQITGRVHLGAREGHMAEVLGPPKVRFMTVGIYTSHWNDLLIRTYIQAGFIMASLVVLIVVFSYLIYVVRNYLLVSKKARQMQEEVERSRRLAAIGSLAAGVAHEIRNPLGSIRGFSQFLYEKCDKGDSRAKYFEMIISEAKRLDSIVNDLLSFAHQKTPQRRDTDINLLIDDVLAIAHQGEYKNIRIEKDFDGKNSFVWVDADQMRQVLLNLIMNAFQAMKGSDSPFLSIRTRLSENVLYIDIRDNGEGIPQENIHKIFDPFFTTKADGTGLGLAIAHQIIESHDGTIHLSSEVGEGTTFKIEIPIGGGERFGKKR